MNIPDYVSPKWWNVLSDLNWTYKKSKIKADGLLRDHAMTYAWLSHPLGGGGYPREVLVVIHMIISAEFADRGKAERQGHL